MPPRPSEGLGRQAGRGSRCVSPWPRASGRSRWERETGAHTLGSPEPGAGCPAAPGPRGRPSPRAGWEVGQTPTGPCPFLHSQPQRRPGHEVLRPDLPQQHRDLERRGPLRLLLPGQPVPQQCGRGAAGRPRRPGGHRRGQPAVGAAPGSLLSPPARAGPGITRALAACVGSVCSTCLPVSPPCLPSLPPPGPTSPLPREALPASGNHQHGNILTQPSPGFRGSPKHPAVGRAPGFSPAPSSPLEGLPLGTPSPSGPASQGPLCSAATPTPAAPVQVKADLRAGLRTHPAGHPCPTRTLAHLPACPLLSWTTHASQTQGTSLGPVGLPPRALRLGLGVLKSRGGTGFLESHQHPCQPLPGWLTTARMGLSPQELSPRMSREKE